MKLSTKLIAAFGVLIGLQLMVGIYASLSLGTVNSNVRELSTNWLPSVQLLGDLRSEINTLRRSELQHIISDSNDDMRSLEEMMENAKTAMRNAEGKYDKLIASAEERAIFNAYRSKVDQYISVITRIIPLSREMKTDQAMALSRNEGRPAFRGALAELNKAIEINARGAGAEGKNAASQVGSARVITVGLVLLSGSSTRDVEISFLDSPS